MHEIRRLRNSKHESELSEPPGMGKLINNIMTAVFFELSGVLPTEQALALLKDCQCIQS